MTDKSKQKILVLSDYYLPGYKSGGGMRTIVNMVDRLHNKFDFYILTRDHDGPLDKETYKNVNIGEWNYFNNAKVYYLHKDTVTFSKLRELILEVQPDLIYTNSYFATLAVYMLTLKKLKRIPQFNVIVAPCGELSKGALSLKAGKKKAFVGVSKIFNLHKDITWKASNEEEKSEIEKVKGRGGKIFIAPDLTPKIIFENYDQNQKPEKSVGEAKMIFLSRFSAKKNFKWLLENLKNVEGELVIDIYGPLEDEDYWQKCVKIIKTLPPNIKVESKGTIPHEQVSETLLQYHFFILPTLGENFGHVFLEALAAGCPLIISDRTPWVDLEIKGIGWDMPLNSPKIWLDKLNECIKMNNITYSNLSANSREFVCEWLKDTKLEEDTLRVLEYGLSE